MDYNKNIFKRDKNILVFFIKKRETFTFKMAQCYFFSICSVINASFFFGRNNFGKI